MSEDTQELSLEWTMAQLVGQLQKAEAERDRLREINAELTSVLVQVRESCLFEDDNGQIGVSEDVTITSYLFDEICRVIKKARSQS